MSVNKVILVGHLGADPDLRYTQNETAVANISLATTERWTKDGERQERTEWHRVVCWGRLAEIAGEYLKKGSQVYFEGKLQTRKWQTDDGQERYTTEVVADELKMLGDPKGSRDDAAPRSARGNGSAQSSKGRSRTSKGRAQQSTREQPAQGWDDDIPF